MMMRMLFYVFIHALLGLIAGILINYLRAESASKSLRWVVYLVGVGISLGLAAVIGELSSQWQVEEFYRWWGAVAVVLSFLAAVAGEKILRKGAKQL